MSNIFIIDDRPYWALSEEEKKQKLEESEQKNGWADTLPRSSQPRPYRNEHVGQELKQLSEQYKLESNKFRKKAKHKVKTHAEAAFRGFGIFYNKIVKNLSGLRI